MAYGQAAMVNPSMSGPLGGPTLPGRTAVSQPANLSYSSGLLPRNMTPTMNGPSVASLYTAEDYRREIARVKKVRRLRIVLAIVFVLIVVVAFAVLFALGYLPFTLPA